MAAKQICLDKRLIEQATIAASELDRTPGRQIEHWANIGKMLEDNPDLPYEFVKQAISTQAERNTGELETYDFG